MSSRTSPGDSLTNSSGQAVNAAIATTIPLHPPPQARRFHRRHYITLDEEVQNALNASHETNREVASNERSQRFPAALAAVTLNSTPPYQTTGPRDSDEGEVEGFGRAGLMRYGRAPYPRDQTRRPPTEREIEEQRAAARGRQMARNPATILEQREESGTQSLDEEGLENNHGQITRVMDVPIGNITAYTIVIAHEREHEEIPQRVLQSMHRTAEDWERSEGSDSLWNIENRSYLRDSESS